MIRIDFDKSDIEKIGDGFVILRCQGHQSPMLPAFILAFTEEDTTPRDARYIQVTHGGTIKLGNSCK